MDKDNKNLAIKSVNGKSPLYAFMESSSLELSDIIKQSHKDICDKLVKIYSLRGII